MSSWGDSWGGSWGNSWGATSDEKPKKTQGDIFVGSEPANVQLNNMLAMQIVIDIDILGTLVIR